MTLLASAFTALADGSGEVVLTDNTISALAVGDPTTQGHFLPHVELAGRIHATGVEALERGDFTITVTPGRSAGTFTSRFTTITPDAGLEPTPPWWPPSFGTGPPRSSSPPR